MSFKTKFKIYLTTCDLDQALSDHRHFFGHLIARPANGGYKINFGLVLYNHANFYRFEETSSYRSVKRISVFSAFRWSTSGAPPASQCVAVRWPVSRALCRPCVALMAGS